MLALRSDQIKDLNTLLKNKRFIHRGHPGTGKTPTICVLQAARYRLHGQATVWPQPKRLMRKNYDEAMAWGGWDEGQVAIVEGGAAVVRKILADPNVQVFIMNFDMFRRYAEELPERVKSVDIDEFHKGFGDHESDRTQKLYDFVNDHVGEEGWFVPMTGTLYNGKPETVFPVLQIIEPTYYPTLKMFKNMHHLVDPFTGKLIGYHGLEVLEEVLSEISIVHTWEEVHGKENIVAQVVYTDMSERQRKAYDEFKDEGLLELEEFFVDGSTPGAAFIRARQIMEHPNAFPNLAPVLDRSDTGVRGNVSVDITPGETPGKLELFELDCEKHAEHGTAFGAFAALIPQQEQLLEVALRVGIRAAMINGKTSPIEADRVDRAFQKGELDAVIGSALTADCGFNWQFSGKREVRECIFASLPFQDTAIDQAMKRFMRQKRLTALLVKAYAYYDSLDFPILRLTHRKSVEASQVEPGRKPLPFLRQAA